MNKRYKNIIHSIKSKAIKKLISITYEESIQEIIGREDFFYKAFKVLKFNEISGIYAEFGCNAGNTFALAHKTSTRLNYETNYWAFDSFKGLPKKLSESDQHPQWNEGEMNTSVEMFHKICAKNKIPKEKYKIVEGFYNKSLPNITTEHETNDIALAYIDCDLYSSTIDVLRFLMPRFKNGMIIAFDDYFCHSESEVSGERKALLKILNTQSKWSLVPFCNIGWHGLSFIVERADKIKN